MPAADRDRHFDDANGHLAVGEIGQAIDAYRAAVDADPDYFDGWHALGMALLKTGGADYLANLFVYITFGARPAIVLMSLMMMMGVLTNVVSNNAAAVIGTPIAIGIAQRLGLPLEPFVLAVMFGANLSFATPMAYQTNILIMNAGGYKFGDFVRVGVPLTIITWLILSGVLIWAYGL